MRFTFPSARTALRILSASLALGSVCAFGGFSDARAADTETLNALNRMSEKVTVRKLSNGMTAIVYRRGIAPVFGGAVVIRVGGVDELPGATGESHLFEHMAFKGTTSVGTVDYERERKLLDELESLVLKRAGAIPTDGADKERWDEINRELVTLWVNNDFSKQYGEAGAVGLNATTDKEFTKYFVNLPVSSFEFWCRMESERLLAPVMRQFYQERDVVMEERRMRYDNSPQGRLYEQLLGVSYLSHPYRNPVIGYPADVSRLTASQVDAFRRRYYVPENMAVSVVGDLDPEFALAELERWFGRIPTGPAPDRTMLEESPQQGERRVEVDAQASPYVMVAYHKPNYPHPDDPAISLMLEVFAGSSLSPLYTELVKKRQMCADVGYSEAPGVGYPNLMVFSLAVKSPYTNDVVLKAFDEVVHSFLRNPPSDEKLEIAKRAISSEYLGRLRSNVAMALDLASSELMFGNWRTLIEWYESALKVTPAEVQRAAKVYLVPSRRTVGTIERLRS